MKNFEAQELLIDLKNLGALRGFSFVMAVSSAIELLEKERKMLEDIQLPNDEFKEYQNKIREVNIKYSHKEENGNPKIITKEQQGNKIQFFDLDESKQSKRILELNKLEKKYTNVINEQKKKHSDYLEALQEESTLKKITIHEKQLPKEITVEQMCIARKILEINK